MNAKTGDLLSVASYPTFNPNTDVGKKGAKLGNVAFSDVFEPGSTSKVMTIAAALEERTVTPSTAGHHPQPAAALRRELQGQPRAPDALPHRRRDARRVEQHRHHPRQRDDEAEDDRVVLPQVRPGRAVRHRLPGRVRGLLPKSDTWSGTKKATIAFGQGLSVTAIQAASVFQTIANDGVRVAPAPRRQRHRGRRHGHEDARRPPPTRVVSHQTAADVSRMLEGVVSDEGTAEEAQIPGYRVAGKTGTAEYYDSAAGGYSGRTASFIGYAPADDPQIVVAVIVQKPTYPFFGGYVAGPVFKDVTTYALQELEDPPTGKKATKVTLKVSPRRPSPTPPCCATVASAAEGRVLRRGRTPTDAAPPHPDRRPRSPRGSGRPRLGRHGHRGDAGLPRRPPGDLYAALPGLARTAPTSPPRRWRPGRWRCSPTRPVPPGSAMPGSRCRSSSSRSRARCSGASRPGSTAPRTSSCAWSASPAPTARRRRPTSCTPRSARSAAAPASSARWRRASATNGVGSVRTTPEAPELHAVLAVMAERGLDTCVMEVSSHALAQHRVDGVVYDVALFTNLSQDHLDFHADMDDYFAAKAALFTPSTSRLGLVCRRRVGPGLVGAGRRCPCDASARPTTRTGASSSTRRPARFRLPRPGVDLHLEVEPAGRLQRHEHRDGRGRPRAAR